MGRSERWEPPKTISITNDAQFEVRGYYHVKVDVPSERKKEHAGVQF